MVEAKQSAQWQGSDFAQRVETMVSELAALTGVKIKTVTIGAGCSQSEIDKVHRMLGHPLSEDFLSYYRSANGVHVTWTCNRFGIGGAFKLQPLGKLFSAKPGDYFMPDAGDGPMSILGGIDEKKLRGGLRPFDLLLKDRAQPGYPGSALYTSADQPDPVVVFSQDAAACLDDVHPMLATSYMEMLLATGGEADAVTAFFAWGSRCPDELVRWTRQDWATLGSAGRYVRWWMYNWSSRRKSYQPGQEALLRSGHGTTTLGPKGWIELRWGLPYPGLPDVTRDPGAEPDMLALPRGKFLMGSVEEGQETVTVQPFAIARHLITLRRYHEVMGEWPKGCSHFLSGPPRPEEAEFPQVYATWYDAVQFCNRLSERAGLPAAYRIDGTVVEWDRASSGYRLPTEQEWEYAARAGTTSNFRFCEKAPFEPFWEHPRTDEYRWVDCRHPIGMKKPNAWGLHDLWQIAQWCWDARGKKERSARGGEMGLVASRSFYIATRGEIAIGFRVVRGAVEAR